MSSNAKFIQIGIVIIENGVICQRMKQMNPHEALDEHIKQLTGLSQSSPISQAAREVYELIEDVIFVAHNVKFDNLLAEVRRFNLLTPRVDTVELAQVYPTLINMLCGQFSELEIPGKCSYRLTDAQATNQLSLKNPKRWHDLLC